MRNTVLKNFIKDNVALDTIFDVGANVGQSIEEFQSFYPAAKIYAFEPAPESYEALLNRFDISDYLKLENYFLSGSSETVKMLADGKSTSNRLVGTNDLRDKVIDVKTITGDFYINEMGIEKIDFLKIDTEGHDFSVLLGFINSLSRKKIKFVQVECSFDRSNKYHVNFNDFMIFFESLGYGLYQITGLSNRLGRSRYSSKKYGDAIFCVNKIL